MRRGKIERHGRGSVNLIASLAVAAGLAAGGTAAYHHFLQRPGEEAVRLIPSDAAMVVTVDITPAEDQLALFSRIGAAVKKERLLDRWNGRMTDTLRGSPVVEQIRPFLAGSAALALWNLRPSTQPGTSNFVAFLAIKDSGPVSQILGEYGQRKSQNGAEFVQFSPEVNAETLGGYLVISDQPSLLARVEATSRGTEHSVGSLQDYRDARASLPHDPNLMVYLSGRALSQLPGLTKAGLSAGGFNASQRVAMRWLAMGATLEAKGIELDTRGAVDDRTSPPLQQLAGIQPLGDDLLKELPAGALAVTAVSQPGEYWRFFTDTAGENPQAANTAATVARAFRTGTGLDFDRDLLPALKGRAAVAVYPAASGIMTVAPILLVFDSANGADPGALAPRLVDAATHLSHGSLLFTKSVENGATIWSTQVGSRLPTSPSAANSMLASAASPRLAIAQCGHELIIGTSPQMVENALSVHRGSGPSLASDPAYSSMVRRWSPHAQESIMVDLGAAMTAYRPALAAFPLATRNTVSVDDIAGLFGVSGAGMVGSGGYDGHTSAGSLFIPLDYDRAIHLAAVLAPENTPSPALARGMSFGI